MSNQDRCTTTTPHSSHSWKVSVHSTCRCPGVRELAPINQFVGVVVVNGAGQVLIVHNVKLDLWCLPGGKPKHGESLIDAARRELYEETNLSFNKPALVASHTTEHVYNGVMWYGSIFMLHSFYGKPGLVCDDEINGIAWVTPELFKTLSPYAEADLGDILEVGS